MSSNRQEKQNSKLPWYLGELVNKRKYNEDQLLNLGERKSETTHGKLDMAAMLSKKFGS